MTAKETILREIEQSWTNKWKEARVKNPIFVESYDFKNTTFQSWQKFRAHIFEKSLKSLLGVLAFFLTNKLKVENWDSSEISLGASRLYGPFWKKTFSRQAKCESISGCFTAKSLLKSSFFWNGVQMSICSRSTTQPRMHCRKIAFCHKIGPFLSMSFGVFFPKMNSRNFFKVSFFRKIEEKGLFCAPKMFFANLYGPRRLGVFILSGR